MIKKIAMIIAVLFFTSLFAFPQEKDTVIVEDEDGVKDTIVIDEDEWNDDDWEDEWDDEWEDWDFVNDFRGRPTVSLDLGSSSMSMQDFETGFAQPALIDAMLGYTSERSSFNQDIVDFNYRYVRITNISTKLSSKEIDESELESSMWRFGFGREGGYGWKFGEAAILPYNGYSFDWSRLEMKDFPSSVAALSAGSEDSTLMRYNESFRFGSSAQGGVMFRIISGITINAAYERSIIFERHLFWKWAGSAIIEVAAQGILDHFIDEVGDVSPYAAPIVSFVLKNALSYGIYELRQEKMNWPFPSAAPLAYDQFKVGLTFVF